MARFTKLAQPAAICQRDNPNDPQLSSKHGLYDVPLQHRGMYLGDGLEAMAVVSGIRLGSLLRCGAQCHTLPGCFIRVVAVVQQEIREREGVFPLKFSSGGEFGEEELEVAMVYLALPLPR